MEEENKQNAPPTRAPFDPGWNDPPLFSYSAAPPKSRLNLNKRVAFPLQSNSSSQQGTMPPMMPSQPLQAPPLPPATNSSIMLPTQQQDEPQPPHVGEVDDDIPSDDEIKLTTFATLKTAFASLPAHQKHQNPEIQRRIENLQSNWNDLDRGIKIILYKIGKAIVAKNVEVATTQHRILVVDHHNACSMWASALRQLILISIPESANNFQSYSEGSAAPITTPFMIPVGATGHSIGEDSTEPKKNFSRVYHI